MEFHNKILWEALIRVWNLVVVKGNQFVLSAPHPLYFLVEELQNGKLKDIFHPDSNLNKHQLEKMPQLTNLRKCHSVGTTGMDPRLCENEVERLCFSACRR